MITDPDQMRAWRKAQPRISFREMDLQIKAGLKASQLQMKVGAFGIERQVLKSLVATCPVATRSLLVHPQDHDSQD